MPKFFSFAILTMLQVLVYLIIEAVAATCFYPNHDVANNDMPCDSSKTDSNCCGPGYACLSNKVCRQAHQDSSGAFMPYTYGRGSCTDRTWTSSSCPQFCIIGSSRRLAPGTWSKTRIMFWRCCRLH